MDVILLEKVENLGALGDKVRVKPGYGRNYLIPKGKAVPATEENLAEFEKRRAELEKVQAEARAAAESRAASLAGLSVQIARKTGDEGRLFGSVGTADIADAVTAAGVELRKHEVRLPAGALRQTGEFEVSVHLHTEVDATLRVEIVPEG